MSKVDLNKCSKLNLVFQSDERIVWSMGNQQVSSGALDIGNSLSNVKLGGTNFIEKIRRGILDLDMININIVILVPNPFSCLLKVFRFKLRRQAVMEGGTGSRREHSGGEIKQQEVFNLVQTKFVSSVGADSVLDWVLPAL